MSAPSTMLCLSAINGALAVAAGAFAAHALKTRLSADMLAVFETAARYHMYHALALGLVAVCSGCASKRMRQAATWCFSAGIVLFCGSLYLLALTGIKALGAITPVGGVAFMAGWLALAIGTSRSTTRHTIRVE